MSASTTFDVGEHEVLVEVYGGAEESSAMFIHLEGTGTMAEANGWPVRIDWYYGHPTVYIWADIDQEEPTHIISMEKALEKEAG